MGEAWTVAGRWALLGLLLGGCGPVPVDFTCGEDEPLCALAEIVGDERVPATGVDITGVRINQGSEVALLVDGEEAAPSDTPLVAGRPGVIVIDYALSEDFEPRKLTARAYFSQGGRLVAAVQTEQQVSSSSDPDDPSTGFLLELPGSLPAGELQLTVGLYEAAGSPGGREPPGLATWPEEGAAALDFEDTGGGVHLYLVPIEMNGLLPDTSAEQEQVYVDYVEGFYPVPYVEIEWGETYQTSTTVSANGTGWDTLLMEITSLRAELGLASDVYIYGLFTPTESLNSFCGGGCVTGLSNLVTSAGDAYSRASIGLGYGGSDAAVSAETMVHEVGHAHGLSHAPCGGAADPDPNFPYDDGSIGVEGYDWVHGVFKDPGVYVDMMSYCSPIWISDYHYDKLFQRVRAVNGAGSEAYLARSSWYVLWQSADGDLRWGGTRSLAGPPSALTREVELVLASGEREPATAYWVPFSHLPGGALLLPAEPELLRVVVDGRESPPRPGADG